MDSSTPQSQAQGQNIPITLPGSRLVVGQVRGVIFYKTVQGSKHFLRKPRAIAFDVATLDAAERAGAIAVCVTDSETGDRYAARIETLRRYGFPVVRGFGRQVALLIEQFAINGQPPRRPAGMPTTNQERQDLQPGLFDGGAL